MHNSITNNELKHSVNLRQAEVRDVEGICGILSHYALEQLLLHRSRENILSHLSQFLVAEVNGDVVACVGVSDFGNQLKEIRSLAVSPEHSKCGIGGGMITAAINLSWRLGARRVFALTSKTNLFLKFGFKVVPKSTFPEKIWQDCEKCPKKNCCDETAVILDLPDGEPPKRFHAHSPEEILHAFDAARGKKVDLFVYGTLMNDHYLELLLNRKVESVTAVLQHYMRITTDWSFPFIVKQHGAKTAGKILRGLSREELKQLDQFEVEGDLYHRRTVVVRVGNQRQRCLIYIGDIATLQKNYGKEVKFEDRYIMYIERKIDEILDEMPTDRPDITRRVLHELMSSAVDSIIQSQFNGNYICNYIMVQALGEARPPKLRDVLTSTPELRPYAGNYMRLACQHIVFNQFVEMIRHDFPDAVRLSRQYFRHGLGIMLGFLYYNRHRTIINRLFQENQIDQIVEGRSYRDYATIAIDIVDQIYHKEEMLDTIALVEDHWYSTPTPIGAELEFSFLGARAVYAESGEDRVYDGFNWFRDFDMFRRTWRLGGHVDSHRKITVGQQRHRGFLEYAFGRYQIVGDLSLPLFDCPWAMSLLINEAVRFLDVPPHSLHVSMELGAAAQPKITTTRHLEKHLVCLMLLGGDIRPDPEGNLREWRIFNNELDTNYSNSLNFSDRKHHFSRPDQDADEASEVMEYKFMRLYPRDTDYESLIVALKGYQFQTHARPITSSSKNAPELPEQTFLRGWANAPQSIDLYDIHDFISTIEKGLLEEHHSGKLDRNKQAILEKIERKLISENDYVASFS